MSDGFSAGLQVTVLVVALVAVHRPLGDWMALAFTSTHHTRGERACTASSASTPTPTSAGRSTPARSSGSAPRRSCSCSCFSGSRRWLPTSGDIDPMPPFQALNTAVSFATNTNWQSYSGESA